MENDHGDVIFGEGMDSDVSSVDVRKRKGVLDPKFRASLNTCFDDCDGATAVAFKRNAVVVVSGFLS